VDVRKLLTTLFKQHDGLAEAEATLKMPGPVNDILAGAQRAVGLFVLAISGRPRLPPRQPS
jgi:hypothetical protein